ncbi:M48 family metallopeptidase [Candidatus Saccharibacteria bacterium]|nr:M48 family metallopeptidase [Candidatus Saccharibacteria bacterium]MCB9821515.1 M48 family metallopeptidase [Candidatus Nomurabacteria bacterium]
MATKSVSHNILGRVDYVKRRGQKNIKIRVLHDRVLVSMPYYTPIKLANQFLNSKIQWIKDNRPVTHQINDGMTIGKSRVLRRSTSTYNKSRLNDKEIIVSGSDAFVEKVILRVLKNDAETLLTERVNTISNQLNLTYTDLKFRRLKSRWGSCDHQKRITLNVLLVQLPWELIDYVIVHELCHTVELNHSHKFWETVSVFNSNYKSLRKQLRAYAPVIYNTAYVDKT